MRSICGVFFVLDQGGLVVAGLPLGFEGRSGLTLLQKVGGTFLSQSLPVHLSTLKVGMVYHYLWGEGHHSHLWYTSDPEVGVVVIVPRRGRDTSFPTTVSFGSSLNLERIDGGKYISHLW